MYIYIYRCILVLVRVYIYIYVFVFTYIHLYIYTYTYILYRCLDELHHCKRVLVLQISCTKFLSCLKSLSLAGLKPCDSDSSFPLETMLEYGLFAWTHWFQHILLTRHACRNLWFPGVCRN